MGFFDHLSPEAIVIPCRPSHSAAQTHFGGNAHLVEIAAIGSDHVDETLPNRLRSAIQSACHARPDVEKLAGSAWLIFTELIGNIGEHSHTTLDGYAALQVYSGGNALHVAVSDSGVGIMNTLRPSLKDQFPHFVAMTDVDLLVEVFRQGISRFGSDRGRGCGLRKCAEKAIKFHSELDVRLPRQRVRLSPRVGGYRPNTAYCSDGLPLPWGTHISFEFELA